ncbi:MAG TPA: hypothetical protein VIE89_15815 [Candidatus Binatia bacterium]
MELFVTARTWVGSFSISILKGVTKVHDTSRILAVNQSPRVAQFMNRLFHRALPERFFIRPHAQPEQRNHRALSGRFSQAENKIQVTLIEVVVSYCQHAISHFRVRDLKKNCGAILLSSSIECIGWNFPLFRDPYSYSFC